MSLFIIYGCLEKPNTSEEKNIKHGKRNYAWSVDTLFYHLGGQVLLESLWGSSIYNIYAVGHDAHAGIAAMWHFNGSVWSRVNLLPPYGGTIPGPFDLRAIYGTDSTNIYAVGNRIYQTFSTEPPYFLDSTFIIQFNGKNWEEVPIKRASGALYSIEGLSQSDIWASGVGKYIHRFNGVQWSIDSIPFPESDSTDFYMNNIISIYKNTPIVLSIVYNNRNGTFKYNYFKKNTTDWQIVDSFTSMDTPKWGTASMWKDSVGNIYSTGNGVYILKNQTWTKLFSIESLSKVWGTKNENLFAVGFNKVYHFNGFDWQKIDIASDNFLSFTSAWGNDSTIFISANNGNVSYIFHGK